MMRNLDTTLVRTFVTAADNASMTAAANALNLTQGAVSQQIRRLEEIFGCDLFERDRRGLRLTPPGERLFGKAKRLLSLNDEIWGDMTKDAVSGRVRLGVPYDLVGTWLAPVLKAYAEACPQVEISLVCASSPELIGLLAAGEIDLAVIEEPVGPSAGECLAIERLVWVGARGGAAHLKRPLPLSMVSETCAFRPVILASLRDRGFAWRTVFESGTIEATRATVEADLAVTAWLAATVSPDLAILGPESGLPPLPSFAINLHLPPHGAGAAAREFARHIRHDLTRHR
ncbi:MAG TPA: LysR substrate-binding domain-containing protein [Aliidongia sp.]|uniref:LysR substrate-binding domain-containing protein n=1 Tax=Aliidongia sp. TaxID=1914230 RepID=UPI002DDCCBD8|nr:LysR substrate-binding domain-containing protein [Aliidongia sp.]HEV2674716.1 LysR substrate-binding domain-containing protein [Aliidongia sp.]